MQTLSPAISSTEESHPTLFSPHFDSNACQRWCLPVCLSYSVNSDHRAERISPSARHHGERASLLSSKGSSDKKRVKAPETLSPERRDFSFFVHFLFCCLSLLFSLLHSFSSVCLSPAGCGGILFSQGPMMGGNLSSSDYKQLLLTFETLELQGVHCVLYVKEIVPS